MSIIPTILNIYQDKKQGGASIREGASVRTNTVHHLFTFTYRDVITCCQKLAFLPIKFNKEGGGGPFSRHAAIWLFHFKKDGIDVFKKYIPAGGIQ